MEKQITEKDQCHALSTPSSTGIIRIHHVEDETADGPERPLKFILYPWINVRGYRSTFSTHVTPHVQIYVPNTQAHVIVQWGTIQRAKIDTNPLNPFPPLPVSVSSTCEVRRISVPLTIGTKESSHASTEVGNIVKEIRFSPMNRVSSRPETMNKRNSTYIYLPRTHKSTHVSLYMYPTNEFKELQNTIYLFGAGYQRGDQDLIMDGYCVYHTYPWNTDTHGMWMPFWPEGVVYRQYPTMEMFNTLKRDTVYEQYEEYEKDAITDYYGTHEGVLSVLYHSKHKFWSYEVKRSNDPYLS